jgi:ABC-type sugar transport system ATPase subunit
VGGGAQSEAYLLELEGIRKSFPGVLALDGVSLRLRPASVHALMGENGAGKSTLMNILAGILQPDAGTIRLHGRAVTIESPRAALSMGIAMIHQELSLMPDLSVAENIWLGREPTRSFGLAVDHARMRRSTGDLLERLRIPLAADARAGDLDIANRQLLEIARALSLDSSILIMDEPTSALTERETERLFELIAGLRAGGTGVIYITHKMHEVSRVADEVSVLRDGRHVATHAAQELNGDDLIREMVGRELSERFPKQNVPRETVALEVRDLSLRGEFTNVSFRLRQGEILGVVGMVGAGRTALAETLFGLRPPTSGEIVIDGRACSIDSPHAAMRAGLALLTEDRKDSGCFESLSVLENMTMACLTTRYARCGWVRAARAAEDCRRLTESLHVKTPTVTEQMGRLSGGNQQKVLIARWLLTNPRILILDEPTRGVDVGAKADIHRLISRLAAEGMAVMMISSEMAEILGISDRILVMQAGRVSGLLERSESDPETIMRLASA